MALDDVVILNVDTNTLETPFDDLQSLPNDVVGSELMLWAPIWLRGGERRETAVVFLVELQFAPLFSLQPLS